LVSAGFFRRKVLENWIIASLDFASEVIGALMFTLISTCTEEQVLGIRSQVLGKPDSETLKSYFMTSAGTGFPKT